MEKVRIGIIGGSGLYQMDGLSDVVELKVETPFGAPSDTFILGTLLGERVAFLPRHGREHTVMPSEVNFRANIYGFKTLGVERIIGISAVGSLREEIEPLDVVIPDQLFDRTKMRPSTFFGDGVVSHVSFADPYCPVLSKVLYDSCKLLEFKVHFGGTYLCIEGPQFSTRAESRIFRQWGADIIGMTNLPEARLAREAEICYATVAMVTDYDVWHESEDVSIEMVIENLNKNIEKAKRLIKESISKIPKSRECVCASSLANAIITPKDSIPEHRKETLRLLIGKYLEQDADS
jgi:5'-methylthioadenosine phosphorylase